MQVLPVQNLHYFALCEYFTIALTRNYSLVVSLYQNLFKIRNRIKC